jgi:alanyl-tRNA synthetase
VAPDASVLRIMADHVRAATMILADGVGPSASGRGYIPRRLIRRAVAASVQSGSESFDFGGMLEVAIGNAKSWNSHVELHRPRIVKTFMQEVADFRGTLGAGLQRLADAFAAEPQRMSAATAFTLYSTYGIPIDVTREYVVSRGGSIDLLGFDTEYRSHQELSRRQVKQGRSKKLGVDLLPLAGADQLGVPATEFVGYEAVVNKGKVVGIFVEGESAVEASAGTEAAIVVDRTAFYAESGGQIGDTGTIVASNGTEFAVRDTQKSGRIFVHLGAVAQGAVRLGDLVELRVDAARRLELRANHSATHLMHESLRRLLGEHVTQKGSLVAPDRLRFDFSHSHPLSAEDIKAVEAEVNARVRENSDVQTQVMPIAKAIEAGALAFFGEKYGDEVRVVSMGAADGGTTRAFSVELCGGTHVRRTGDIGLFKIVAETAVGAGVRRVEALTGAEAEAHVDSGQNLLAQAAAAIRAAPSDLPRRLIDLIEERRRLERELDEARRRIADGGPKAGNQNLAKNLHGVRFLGRVFDEISSKDLRGFADEFKAELGSGIVAVVSRSSGKGAIVVSVTGDLVTRFNSVDLARVGAEELGGKGGGGRPDMAQAGGPNAKNAEMALKAIEQAVSEMATAKAG